MDKRSDDVGRMEARLKQWDADFEAFAAKGEKANADALDGYRQRVKSLRQSRDDAQESFQALRLANSQARGQMLVGMNAAWETMRKALAKLTADLGK